MIPFAYFGTAPISHTVLEELFKRGFKPSLIVTYPDKAVGRSKELTKNVVADFASKNLHGVPVIKAPKLTPDVTKEIIEKCTEQKIELFVVMAYGRIIPKALLDFPKFGSINVHPSLLPKFRGPAPLQANILNTKVNTNLENNQNQTIHGISIMLLDEEMDHGAIIAQESFPKIGNEILAKNGKAGKITTYTEYEKLMAKEGARMLTEVLPKWISGEIKAIPQKHEDATYTKKTEKEDGFIKWHDLLSAISGEMPDLALNIALKFSAYTPWPSIYTINPKDNKRVKITALHLEGSSLDSNSAKIVIDKIIQEGKPEIETPKNYFSI